MIVLRAASREFLRNGIVGTSIDSIAIRLNVKKPTIYHYGGSKDEIVRECLRIGAATFAKLNDEIEQQLSGLDKLRVLFRHYVRYVADDFGRLLVTVNPRALSEEARKEYALARRNTLAAVRQLIEQAHADGSLKVDDPHLATLTIIGAFNFIGNWYREDGEYTPDQIYEGMMKLFLNGIGNRELRV